MQVISLNKVSSNSKILLLNELGYGTDGEFVLNKDGEKFLDRYLDVPIKVDNMIILPGSEIILDDNELSVSSYLEEFGDAFGRSIW